MHAMVGPVAPAAATQGVGGQVVEAALLKSLAPVQDCMVLPDSQVGVTENVKGG